MYFFNRCFDKNRLKALILWLLNTTDEDTTLEIVEKLKDLGFQYATKAGLSLSIDDLKIPPRKDWVVSEAGKLVEDTHQEYLRGRITSVESIQQLVDTWHRASEILKKEVIQHFQATDILNPVYMMAFSGARGNISQVRQLVGMRGLMADPQGQIIGFPIRSNFKEGLTVTEYMISCYGARKGLVDTALRTADAGYLTRRLVDVSQHVVVRIPTCATKKGIFLKDIKDSGKVLLSLKDRLIGRVLSADVLSSGSSIRPSSMEEGELILPLLPAHKGDLSVKDVNTQGFVGQPSLLTPKEVVNTQGARPKFSQPLVQRKREAVLSQPLPKGLRQHNPYTREKNLFTQSEAVPFPGEEGEMKTKDSFLGFRNQEISPSLATKLAYYHKKILVRSPLTCSAQNGICQMCYGWSLSEGRLVTLGEAVGIVAAQSIGEPGTQLTMRTFHTGGVFSGDVLDEIKAPFPSQVFFNRPLEGVLIRTPHGKIGFLTRNKGQIICKSNKQEGFEGHPSLREARPSRGRTPEGPRLKAQEETTVFQIERSTILFVRQNENVPKDYLLAESSSFQSQTNERAEAKKIVFSDISGQVFFSQMVVGRMLDKDGQFICSSRDIGSIWILAGQSPETSFSLPFYKKGSHLVNQSTLIGRAHFGSFTFCSSPSFPCFNPEGNPFSFEKGRKDQGELQKLGFFPYTRDGHPLESLAPRRQSLVQGKSPSLRRARPFLVLPQRGRKRGNLKLSESLIPFAKLPSKFTISFITKYLEKSSNSSFPKLKYFSEKIGIKSWSEKNLFSLKIANINHIEKFGSFYILAGTPDYDPEKSKNKFFSDTIFFPKNSFLLHGDKNKEKTPIHFGSLLKEKKNFPKNELSSVPFGEVQKGVNTQGCGDTALVPFLKMWRNLFFIWFSKRYVLKTGGKAWWESRYYNDFKGGSFLLSESSDFIFSDRHISLNAQCFYFQISLLRSLPLRGSKATPSMAGGGPRAPFYAERGQRGGQQRREKFIRKENSKNLKNFINFTYSNDSLVPPFKTKLFLSKMKTARPLKKGSKFDFSSFYVNTERKGFSDFNTLFRPQISFIIGEKTTKRRWVSKGFPLAFQYNLQGLEKRERSLVSGWALWEKNLKNEKIKKEYFSQRKILNLLSESKTLAFHKASPSLVPWTYPFSLEEGCRKEKDFYVKTHSTPVSGFVNFRSKPEKNFFSNFGTKIKKKKKQWKRNPFQIVSFKKFEKLKTNISFCFPPGKDERESSIPPFLEKKFFDFTTKNVLSKQKKKEILEKSLLWSNCFSSKTEASLAVLKPNNPFPRSIPARSYPNPSEKKKGIKWNLRRKLKYASGSKRDFLQNYSFSSKRTQKTRVSIKPGWIYIPKNSYRAVKLHKSYKPMGTGYWEGVERSNFDPWTIQVECSPRIFPWSKIFCKDIEHSYFSKFFNLNFQTLPIGYGCELRSATNMLEKQKKQFVSLTKKSKSIKLSEIRISLCLQSFISFYSKKMSSETFKILDPLTWRNILKNIFLKRLVKTRLSIQILSNLKSRFSFLTENILEAKVSSCASPSSVPQREEQGKQREFLQEIETRECFDTLVSGNNFEISLNSKKPKNKSGILFFLLADKKRDASEISPGILARNLDTLVSRNLSPEGGPQEGDRMKNSRSAQRETLSVYSHPVPSGSDRVSGKGFHFPATKVSETKFQCVQPFDKRKSFQKKVSFSHPFILLVRKIKIIPLLNRKDEKRRFSILGKAENKKTFSDNLYKRKRADKYPGPQQGAGTDSILPRLSKNVSKDKLKSQDFPSKLSRLTSLILITNTKITTSKNEISSSEQAQGRKRKEFEVRPTQFSKFSVSLSKNKSSPLKGKKHFTSINWSTKSSFFHSIFPDANYFLTPIKSFNTISTNQYRIFGRWKKFFKRKKPCNGTSILETKASKFSIGDTIMSQSPFADPLKEVSSGDTKMSKPPTGIPKSIGDTNVSRPQYFNLFERTQRDDTSISSYPRGKETPIIVNGHKNGFPLKGYSIKTISPSSFASLEREKNEKQTKNIFKIKKQSFSLQETKSCKVFIPKRKTLFCFYKAINLIKFIVCWDESTKKIPDPLKPNFKTSFQIGSHFGSVNLYLDFIRDTRVSQLPREIPLEEISFKTGKSPSSLLPYTSPSSLVQGDAVAQASLRVKRGGHRTPSFVEKRNRTEYFLSKNEGEIVCKNSQTSLLSSKETKTQESFPETLRGDVNTQLVSEFLRSTNSKKSCCGSVLTKKDQYNLSIEQQKPTVSIGQLLHYGEEIAFNIATAQPGQILAIDKNKICIRKGQAVLFYSGGLNHVSHGQFVAKNSPLLTLTYQKLITGDIVQGIPKIEQFFEAPVTKDGEPLSESLGLKLRQAFHRFRGSLSLPLAARQSVAEIQEFVVEGIQKVYLSQGVLISDKHIEIIVRQMTSKGKIVDGGNTGLLPGEYISLQRIESINLSTQGRRADYEPAILGITQASLDSESFISAASFQETTRVLSRDSLEGKTDFLRGLKERVVLGDLIQAGTGLDENLTYGLVMKEEKEKNSLMKSGNKQIFDQTMLFKKAEMDHFSLSKNWPYPNPGAGHPNAGQGKSFAEGSSLVQGDVNIQGYENRTPIYAERGQRGGKKEELERTQIASDFDDSEKLENSQFSESIDNLFQSEFESSFDIYGINESEWSSFLKKKKNDEN